MLGPLWTTTSGTGGLQVSVDRNEERIKRIYDTLSRCVAARAAK